MICTNCGKENEEGSVFCTGCGNKISNNAFSDAVQETSKGTIIFRPKKIIGQTGLRNAVIDINGEKNVVRFNRELQIKLPIGDYDFMCYGEYIGKANKTNGHLNIKSGETVVVTYKIPIFVFLRGKIQVDKQ